MKKIEGLNEDIKVLPSSEKEDLSKLDIPKLRMVFLNSVANARGFAGDKAVRLMKIGLALLACSNEIVLEDADASLLKEVFDAPQQPYTSFIMGQAILRLSDAKDVQINK